MRTKSDARARSHARCRVSANGISLGAGQSYALTAGHCLPAQAVFRNPWASAFTSVTPPSSSYYFGALSTTTLRGTESALTDGTQDHYGDWSLVAGSNYGARVYNGPPSGTSSSLAVSSEVWSNYPGLNTQWCTSGRTTGQTCRLFVTDSDLVLDFGAYNAARLVLMRSNQDLTGSTDCAGPRSGDSGGGVYKGAGTGYVTVLANITAAHLDEAANDCWYVFSKISGLLAWNPNVTISHG